MTSHLPQNDAPALQDTLGRQVFIDRIAKIIEGCQPPQVFGLHGDWGSGKTSAMHQLQKKLTGVCPHNSEDKSPKPRTGKDLKCKVVWFEAWRYESERAPIVALLHEIRTNLAFSKKIVNQSGKLFSVALRSLLDIKSVTENLIGVGVTGSSIQKHGEQWEDDHFAVALPTHVIRNQLDDAIKQLIKPQDRLVVLIDDLDRCDPKTAYKLLEGIKIYLNLPSCVFVLGMNQRVIERYIATNFKEEGGDPIFRAREYLEKICQDPWQLPLLNDPGGYLEKCLDGFPLAKAFAAIAKSNDCLPRNPRKIKSLANILRRYADHPMITSRPAGKPLDQPYREEHWAMLSACLYHFHPEIYQRILHWPDFLAELDQWARTGESEHDLFVGERDKEGNRKDRLKRPKRQDKNANSPTPGTAPAISSFIDPDRTDSFLLQSLLKAIPGGITTNEFANYRIE